MEIITYPQSAANPLTPIFANSKVSGLSNINVARDVTFTDGAIETYMYSSFEYPNPQDINLPTFSQLQSTKGFQIPFPNTDTVQGTFKGWILSPKEKNPIPTPEQSLIRVVGGECFIIDFVYQVPMTIQIDGTTVDSLIYPLQVCGKNVQPFNKTIIKELATRINIKLSDYKGLHIMLDEDKTYNTTFINFMPLTLKEVPNSIIVNFTTEESKDFYWWADEKNHDMYIGSCTEVFPKPELAEADPQIPFEALELSYKVDQWRSVNNLYILDDMYPINVTALFQQVNNIIGMEKLHPDYFESAMMLFGGAEAFNNKDLCIDWVIDVNQIALFTMFSVGTFKTLTIPNFKVEGQLNEEELTAAFAICDNLQHIYVGSDWKLIPGGDSKNVFDDSPNLHNWNEAEASSDLHAIIDDGTNGGFLEFANIKYLINNNQLFLGYEMPTGKGEPQIYTDQEGLPPWANNARIKKVTITNRLKLNYPDRLFQGLINLEEIVNLRSLMIPDATSTFRMFADCHKLYNIDVSGFQVSNIIDAKEMFYNCWNLQELDLTNWVFQNPVDCSSMFAGIGTGVDQYQQPIYTIDLSSFDTSMIYSMANILANTNNNDTVSTINLRGWDFSNVENMSGFVSNRKSLKQLLYDDEDCLTCNSVIDLSYAFNNTGLEQISISSPMVQILTGFAANTKSLLMVILKDISGATIINTNNMFANSNVSDILVDQNSDWTNIADSTDMFVNCFILHNWRQENPTDKTYAIIDNGINGGYFRALPEALL